MNQKLIAPGVKGLKRLGRIDVVYKHTTIGTTVESYAQRLKTLLTGGIPELESDNAIVDSNFFGKEVGTYCCLVRGRELLIDLEAVRPALHLLKNTHILVHQTGFAYTTIA